MEKSELIEEINKAFSKNSFPERGNIVNNQQYFETQSDFESEEKEVIKIFEGKKWQEIDTDKLVYENGALALLSDEAFNFYLPAYMILIVQDPEKADILWDYTISSLKLPEEQDFNINKGDIEKSRKYFYNKMEGFSVEQKVSIKHFLEYLFSLEDEETEKLAIGNYWGKF